MSDAVDPDHFAEEWATDQEILDRMLDGGDRPHVVREIDVQFVGELAKLNRFKDAASEWGFRSAQVERYEDGWQIELQIHSDTQKDSMRKLTRKYIEIEQEFDIDHDGWGCFSCNENGPISDENPA